VSAADPDVVWDQVVDVVDDYFRIEREDRIRRVGNVVTEGRIDTVPEIGATVFEPHRHDSVGGYERLESTLQTIRRRALVRVTPSESGYWVDVFVYKELEDLERPSHSTAGAVLPRFDSSLERYREPVGGQVPTVGWIPLGRDAALEQRMIAQIQSRLGAPAYSMPPPDFVPEWGPGEVEELPTPLLEPIR